MDIRIGHGYDVHALAEGLPLYLGGVKVEHTKGCVAHSDGDVAIHAICDALLGALALGDIGKLFPRYQSTNNIPKRSIKFNFLDAGIVGFQHFHQGKAISLPVVDGVNKYSSNIQCFTIFVQKQNYTTNDFSGYDRL